MKRTLFAVAAIAALFSCTKIQPIETPQLGEAVVLTVPATKVSLDGNDFCFEAGDQITVVSSKGLSAVLTNSESALSTFSGEFNGFLEDSEEFVYYYNCSADSFVQNGKPWLVAEQSVSRSENGSYDNLAAELSMPEGVIDLAFTADYAGSFDMTANSAEFASFDGSSFSGKTLGGIAFAAGEPVFVNVPSGMEGGFYLAVSKEGESGKMYSSYASSSTISSNSKMKIKDFAAFKGAVDFSEVKTTYDYYLASDITTANATDFSMVSGGDVVLTFSGVSSSLLESVDLTVNGSTVSYSGSNLAVSAADGIVTATVKYAGTNITDFGSFAVSAKANFKNGETYSDSVTKYITGLPYKAQTPSNSGNQAWTDSQNVTFASSYIQLKPSTRTSASSVLSPKFSIPGSGISVNVKLNNMVQHSYKWLVSWITNEFTVTGNTLSQSKTSSKVDLSSSFSIEGTDTFTSSKNYLTFKCTSTGIEGYTQIGTVAILYR